MAMTAIVSELFRKNEKIGPYQRSGLWRHLVAVGLCTRMIALRLKFVNFEDMFLAGLLHDIGIILEDQYFHEPFCQMMLSLDESKTLTEVEHDYLDFDHTMFGGEVAKLWGFPEGVKAPIRYHHTSQCCQQEHINTVHCVEVANMLCTMVGVPSVGMKLVKFNPTAIASLGLDQVDISVLAEDLHQELTTHTTLLNI